jgi:hypothetical protein
LPSTAASTMGRADTKWREIEAFWETLSTERVTCWCYKEDEMNWKQCYRAQDWWEKMQMCATRMWESSCVWCVVLLELSIFQAFRKSRQINTSSFHSLQWQLLSSDLHMWDAKK